ncbi:hypothetical protein JCM14076_19210 [Methylosoma difficile]
MKKYNLLILIAGVSVLLLSQYKIVMPFVYKVVSSDLFLVDSKDKASQLPINNNLTAMAFTQCNASIKKKLPSDANAAFPSKPINAWSMGNYQYIINGETTLNSGSSDSKIKKYACRISYKNGENEEGIENPDNWSIEGLSGLDN